LMEVQGTIDRKLDRSIFGWLHHSLVTICVRSGQPT
jgi:hypothetical protein